MSRRRVAAPWFVVFLVSAAAIGYELALTRYFAVANWAEYGYWVISIAMTGLALSGVAAGLAPGYMRRHAGPLLALGALGLPVCAALGYHIAASVPFNPLALQNRELWWGQLRHIALYDLALAPFFFCVGICLNAAFMAEPGAAPLLYAADLAGAGAGAAAVLALAYRVRPFDLTAVLLPGMGLALIVAARRRWQGWKGPFTAILVTAGCCVIAGPLTRPGFFEYKSVFAPLHVQGARVAGEFRSPRGWDLLLDNFTERLDTDLSNNYGVLLAGGPPRSLGLYRDGERIASVRADGPSADSSYLRAALDVLPFRLLHRPRVLLVGARGGFRPAEAGLLGAGEVTTLEPDPVLRRLLPDRLPTDARAPLAFLAGTRQPFDLIDIAADFVQQNEANRSLVTVEGLAQCLRGLAPGGLVSIPAPIKDLPVYAVIAASTAREALRRTGVAEPGRHVLVYRSAWNARVLVSRDPILPATMAALRALCDERSFDLSFGAGTGTSNVEIWNDLPRVTFDQAGGGGDGEPHDALAEDLRSLFGPDGDRWVARSFFDVAPRTLDRPNPRAALRPGGLAAAIRHLELVPRDEVPTLVAAAVALQAGVMALVIVGLPLVFGRGGRVAATVYFGCLGLGFLLVEITLIDKASLFLGDRATAFGLVLAGMLLCSGLGSFWLQRSVGTPVRRLRGAVVVFVIWIAAAVAGGDRAMMAGQGWSFALKEVLVLIAIAPAGFALGMPFPLGLGRFAGIGGDGIPWAWAVNGAASVLASPLAALLGLQFGGSRVLAGAGALYLVAFAAFRRPGAR